MNKPLNICIIQLTRIGDIIQTYRAAKQLKVENPNAKLTLIARKRFSGGLHFLLNETFDEIIEFETKDFFPNPKDSLKDVRIRLSNFLFDIKKKEFNLVVNLSFTKSSSFLTTLIAKELKMGIYRNEKSQLGIDDKWSQFIYSNVMETPSCPLNLVDIYKSILGAKETDVTSFETPKNKIITLHPFASTHKKSWGSAKWSELIYKLLKEDSEVEINIVGAKSDQDLADRIVDNSSLKIFSKRINSLIGKNSIEDTFNTLAESHLFIGHDSMVSHLAGLLRMPSIILSLGTVRPHETTPYNDRVVNLAPRNNCFPCQVQTSCELLPCHGGINYQTVAAIAHNIIQNNDFDPKVLLNNLAPFHLDNVNIFTAVFDEAGLQLSEVSGNTFNSTEVFRTFYRMIWSYYLKGREVGANPPILNKDITAELAHHVEGSKHLFELYTHGFQFCNAILDESEKDSPSIPFIQDTVAKLAEIDELVMMTKRAYPHLTPIADFFFVHKSNAAGNNIIEITNNNLIAFHEATNVTAILNDLLTKTVGPRINNESIKEV